MLEKLLEKLGLSEKEAKVYLATLELGQDTVQHIAKKAGVVRPTTYVILEKLMQTGLVSTVEEGKKTLFIAESPRELANLLEEQQHQIELRRKELDESMNQLEAIYNASGSKPIVRYYEGEDGLLAMDRYGNSKLSPRDSEREMRGIAPIHILEKLFPERRKEAIAHRTNLKIKSRSIYTRDQGPLPSEVDKSELREGLYLKPEDLPINMSISIYPWGVQFFYLDDTHPYGVTIEDRGIAKNMNQIFDLAWDGAKLRAERSRS